MRLPYTYFGGAKFRSPNQWISAIPITQIQTDGSFHCRNKQGAVAAILHLPSDSKHQYVHQLYNLESSTEAEWASVYYGLQLGLNMNQKEMGLENDCLGVVRHIMFNDSGKKEYARYYHKLIQELATETEWCGIRWIPRAENMADGLFRQRPLKLE
jgi:ribonuclease HI